MDKYTIAPPAGSTQNSVGAEDRPWHEGYFEKLVADNTTRIVNTVADMKADSDLKAGDTVQTLGYYSVDDGCGETYVIIDSLE